MAGVRQYSLNLDFIKISAEPLGVYKFDRLQLKLCVVRNQ
jgi:hypothetical protein